LRLGRKTHAGDLTCAPQISPAAPSSRIPSRKTLVLCFHIHTDSFCRNSPILIFIQIARGVYPKELSPPALFQKNPKVNAFAFSLLRPLLKKTPGAAAVTANARSQRRGRPGMRYTLRRFENTQERQRD
jgi:hypothetical protein